MFPFNETSPETDMYKLRSGKCFPRLIEKQPKPFCFFMAADSDLDSCCRDFFMQGL